MKRIYLKLVSVIILIMIVVPSAFAMPYNSGINHSYNYTSDGDEVETPSAFIPSLLMTKEAFGSKEDVMPEDIHTDNTYVYVLDKNNNRIYLLDSHYRLVTTIQELTGSQVNNHFSQPEGLFVNNRGEIYVADTVNRRIVVCNIKGEVIKEYSDPGISVLQEKVEFLPSKIAVNKNGRMYVVVKNVNRGLVEISPEGTWSGFIGAPEVQVDWSTYIWKMFATREQRSRMQSYVPTEYNNVTIDRDGFVFGTIGTLPASAIKAVIRNRDMSATTAPIKKLNALGEDILNRAGFFAPVGDLVFTESESCSTIVDVSVLSNGIYTIADSSRGRIFTYDQDGNLLYIMGKQGKQFGSFQLISSVAYMGADLLVADKVGGSITVMQQTDYGACINKAVTKTFEGDYNQADVLWNQALSYDANLYTAYLGKGKAEYRQGNYKKAMEYYKIIGDTVQYSKAKRMLRKVLLERYSTFIGIGAITMFLAVSGFLYYRMKKKKRGGNR